MISTNQTCKNCSNSFTGNYCNRCGEKVYTEHDKSLKHIFEESFHFFTHFDGKFFTTLKTIFTWPGKMSLDYCNGLRKKYFKPVSLFLLCIVLYLLFPVFPGLNMKMNSYINGNNITRMVRPVAEKKVKSTGLTMQELSHKYDEESPKIAKIFLLTLIPLSALFLSLLFFTRHRHFFDHIIMATEFGSIYIIIIFLLMPLIKITGTLIYQPFQNFFREDNQPLFFVIAFLLLIILTISFKRFYQESWPSTIIKSILFLFIFLVVITFIYNTLLFLTVMLLI
jgi:hypothetical protein